MSDPWHILASRDDFGGLFELVLFLILGIGSLIVTWLKKRFERQQAERQRQQQEAQAGLAGKPPAAQPAGERPNWLQLTPRMRQSSQPSRPPKRAKPRQAPVLRPVPAAEPRAALHVAPEMEGLHATRIDGAESEHHEDRAFGARPALAALGLDEPDQARRAFIFQEILSPPKALRNSPDSWEM